MNHKRMQGESDVCHFAGGKPSCWREYAPQWASSFDPNIPNIAQLQVTIYGIETVGLEKM